ncbi:DsrE family protein [Agitococcus lubricus]|uniref:tRNA 2-thiouridine synthesizing protein C n=1 Tax=Agitococcus lubricus TaxID=1077255 RepID=A0A2T5IWK4_9GAMM|nr:DsrE family protein [Agitococcus lubricus]PTQ88298.1 tRNA 2-thiouridine synthesizing protein C [Agitococcus lubricus]
MTDLLALLGHNVAILYIQHRSPYANLQSQETLDALLVMAAFGQLTRVLFQGDGVWQLVGEHHGHAFARTAISAQLQALDLYEVDEIFVDAQSLASRQLTLDDLTRPVQLIASEQIATFISQHAMVVRL